MILLDFFPLFPGWKRFPEMREKYSGNAGKSKKVCLKCKKNLRLSE